MPARRLPPYATLRSMVVDQGLSYRAIGQRYGVGYDNVYHTLKSDARRAGDEWPIKRDLTRVVRKGIEEATLETTWVREALLEAYDEAQEGFIPAVVYVNQQQATRALTQPKCRRPRYHRPGCVYVTDTDLQIPFDQTRVRNYVPCGTCCHKLSLREWSKQVGIDWTHLSAVMSKKSTRIRKTTAVKMLQAIGEEPHESLVTWQPYWQERKWRRARARGAAS